MVYTNNFNSTQFQFGSHTRHECLTYCFYVYIYFSCTYGVLISIDVDGFHVFTLSFFIVSVFVRVRLILVMFSSQSPSHSSLLNTIISVSQ